MKDIFIINPNAGTGDITNTELRIRDAAERKGQEFDIYYTKCQSDATDHIRRVAKAHPDQALRFIGIGGDGTVNEVCNGVRGLPNAVAGVIPQGTGNDFIRNFGTFEEFNDLDAQLAGHAETVDLIRTTWTIGDESRSLYCANMINIGFDCNVVVQAGIYARKKAFNGSSAYLAGVVKMLGRMEGTNLRIELDNGEVYDGPILLVAIGNGCYCGGGVKGVPRAQLSDGLMDVSIVNHMSRRKFISMYPSYAKGTHLEKPGTEDFITYRTARKVTITSNRGPVNLSNDGEIFLFEKLELEMEPACVKFNVPHTVKDSK